MSYTIVDIDGTLTITGNTPNESVIAWLRANADNVAIVSARPISRLEETRAWLEANNVPHDEVYLNDFDGAGQGPNVGLAFKKFKAEELLQDDEVDLAIDNDPEVRAAYRALGIRAVGPNNLEAVRSDCPGCVYGEGSCACDVEAPTPAVEATEVTEVTEDTESTEGLLIEEVRAVDLTPPDYMREAAAKGLELLEFAGDGLVDRTIREARDMAAGQVTADKWVRIAAWLARHRVDLEDAPEPGEDGKYTAGQVAHLLWGSEPTLQGNDRARAYAEGVVVQLEAEASERNDEETMSIEFRNVTADFVPSGDGFTYRGHIALFDSPSSPALGFTEVIKRGAFSKSISAADRGEWEVKAFQDHKPELFLGSTKTGTVSLVEDERGLLAEVRLNPEVSYASDLAATMKRDGAAMGASFGFTVPSKGDRWTDNGATRELTNIRLHEVSILTGNAPAYPATVGLGAVRALAERIEAEPAQVRDAVDAMLRGELDADRAAFIRAALGRIAPEPEAIAAPAEDEAPVVVVDVMSADVPASIRELHLRLMAAARPTK